MTDLKDRIKINKVIQNPYDTNEDKGYTLEVYFGGANRKQEAEQLKKDILEALEIEKHYNGDTYFFKWHGTFWIPTNASDLQTAEDDLSLFVDKELRQLEDFNRFREWAEYKELKEKVEYHANNEQALREIKRILEEQIKFLKTTLSEVREWYGINQLHTPSDEAVRMIKIIDNKKLKEMLEK